MSDPPRIVTGTEMVSALIGKSTDAVLGYLLERAIEPFGRYLAQRREDAISELQEELRLAGLSEEEYRTGDANGAAVLKLIRCAEEGTARVNLRMLAQIIASQWRVPPRTQDEFQFWASILASLTYEEIVFLGTLYRNTQQAKEKGTLDTATTTLDAMKASKEELSGGGRLFGSNPEEFELTASGLTRTGLVLAVSAFGAIQYKVTSRMDRLVKLIRLEELADAAKAGAGVKP